MIDYDDLRKKAETAKERQKQYEHRYELYHPESAEFLYSGPRFEHALMEYRESATPDVTLRLLQIVEVAKGTLHRAKSHDLHHGKVITIIDSGLDEIAKIENE